MSLSKNFSNKKINKYQKYIQFIVYFKSMLQFECVDVSISLDMNARYAICQPVHARVKV